MNEVLCKAGSIENNHFFTIEGGGVARHGEVIGSRAGVLDFVVAHFIIVIE